MHRLRRVHISAMTQAWPDPPTWLSDYIKFPPFNPWQDQLHDSLAELREFNAEQVREWIKSACEELGISPTQLARNAQLAASTVNRFLRSKGQAGNLGATTIEALREAITRALTEKVRREAAGSEIRGPLFGEVRGVEVFATLGWYSHLRNGLIESSHGYFSGKIVVPLPSFLRTLPVHGFEVIGDGMKDIYPTGSVVLAVPYTSLERAPKTGERVITHFPLPHTHGQPRIESLAMEFVSDPQGDLWLLSRGTAQSRHLGKEFPSTDNMYISHLVVAHYELEPVLRPVQKCS